LDDGSTESSSSASPIPDAVSRRGQRVLPGHDTKAEGVDGLFNLDGVLVPFPGHPDLPVENRAQCQCTILSVTVVDALEEAVLGE